MWITEALDLASETTEMKKVTDLSIYLFFTLLIWFLWKLLYYVTDTEYVTGKSNDRYKQLRRNAKEKSVSEWGQTEVDFYKAALISVFSHENHFPK